MAEVPQQFGTPDTPTCRLLAVTGTDTDIGKTVVTMSLAARARALGLRVAAMKPIESGVASHLPGESDSERLERVAASGYERSTIGPIVLDEALAPMMAAMRAGITIDFDVLDRARTTLASNRDLLLVEGAGGLLVPITIDCSFATLFAQWNAELIVVSGNRLGVLNHTLLTVRVAESEGLTVRAVVLTDLSCNDPSVAEATNYDALVALLPHVPIHRFPWIERLDDPSALAAAAAGAGLDDYLLHSGSVFAPDNLNID